jgi:prolyl oligopeptidase PreP (S9A serine peptidase family)
MTCRHAAGDPNCSSNQRHQQTYVELERLKEQLKSPDNTKFDIVQVEQVGKHLVLKVLYQHCEKCSYEGNKVMVFLNTSPADALLWKVIDPHFRDDKRHAKLPREAPSPEVRFPASEKGWTDAIAYAKTQ